MAEEEDILATDELKLVIERDKIPCVIDDELLKRIIESQRPMGEATRLDFRLVTVLKLELLNLIKIDHIWMMFNLEQLSLKCNKIERIENLENLKKLHELDLSFNCIMKIDKLDHLTELKGLSLFQNKIRRVENLDRLKKLVRLSLGNNLIDTTDGVSTS